MYFVCTKHVHRNKNVAFILKILQTMKNANNHLRNNHLNKESFNRK